MQKLQESSPAANTSRAGTLPVSVIVAVRNEARNLPACLESLRGVAEVYVIDSQSTDQTVQIARAYGAQAVQFHYAGGWPKKRQWAMDTLPLAKDWILLMDADEALTPALKEEIRKAVNDCRFDGYSIALEQYFLGRELRHCGARLYKLSLFRRGQGRFECRLKDQDASMADMEVHEHIVVEGRTARLKNPLLHRNLESLSHYISKHNEYSNWEAQVWRRGEEGRRELPPSLFGSQAQRRRWLRKNLFALPGSPILFFLYRYFLRLGFLDGMPGLIYCVFQGIQFFHIKAKIYELRAKEG
ncbi:MAG TPA: glycosyltransferase family 2 protein [Terriglobales bacterium]|nr:glycosyltransferase family 2 protein [Terriglobales bacterium]